MLLTAGIYASRANLNVLVLERGAPGGQMLNTEDIENYPSYIQTTGLELSDTMYKHALSSGINYINDNVTNITKNETDGLFTIECGSTIYVSKSVILSTGTNHLKLGVPGEDELSGRGVSYCAICDGGFFRNKEVVVVGGGDSAVEEAMYLTQFVSKVTILVRNNRFTAQPVLVDRLLKNSKVSVIFNASVTEFVGSGDDFTQKLTSVKFLHDGHPKELAVQGAFIYIGMKPNSSLVKELVELDSKGYVITDARMKTSLEGFYAVGDVRNTPLRQIISACGDGSIAGQEVYHYIENL